MTDVLLEVYVRSPLDSEKVLRIRTRNCRNVTRDHAAFALQHEFEDCYMLGYEVVNATAMDKLTGETFAEIDRPFMRPRRYDT